MHSPHYSTSVSPCEELSFNSQTKAHLEHIPESLICKLKKVHLFNNYFAINHQLYIKIKMVMAGKPIFKPVA